MKKIIKFNAWLGLAVTKSVGTMWCAYAFAAIALISLPEAIDSGTSALITWVTQTFLQLVLLSILMVGQSQLEATTDASVQKILTTVTDLVEPIRNSNEVVHQMVGELHDLYVGTRTPEERNSNAEGTPPE